MKFFFFFVLVGCSFCLGASPIPLLFGSEDFLKEELGGDFNQTKSKKKEKIPIMWGGSSLTQEERLYNGIPMKTYILSGGAYIMHKSVKLTAREIEIFGEEALFGNLKGQVIVEDFENGVTLYAKKGVYDKTKGTVSLDNSPTLVQRKNGKSLRMKCESIVRYLEEVKTVLTGSVSVVSEEFQVFGEDAIFLEKEDRVDLSGDPFLFSNKRFLTGNTLTYFVKEGNIELSGSATIYQVSYETKKKSNATEKQTERVISVLTSNKMTHRNQSGDPVTTMSGEAFLLRPTQEFQAEQIESRKNNKEIRAEGKVSFLDKDNGFRMEGGLLEYSKDKSYTSLSQSPTIYFLNKKDLTERGKLTSYFIERFEDREEAVARGDVAVFTKTAEARGEYATYFEKKDELMLEGNPTLSKDKTVVSAGRIILYPKSDKALLTDGLKVIPRGEKK